MTLPSSFAPATDAASGGDDPNFKERRKLTKKLNEIDRLVGLDRALSPEEEVKVSKKEEHEAALSAISSPEDAQLGALKKKAGDRLLLAKEYLECVEEYPSGQSTQSCIVFHLRRIAKEWLLKYQLMDSLLRSKSLKEARKVIEQALSYRDQGEKFVWDPEKEARDKAAAELKKHEEGKRKSFEDRMKRKSKRDGKPLDFYLKQGLEAPKPEDLVTCTNLDESKRVPWWRERFGQHCFPFHNGECARGRGCAFLHVEVASAADEDFAANWNE